MLCVCVCVCVCCSYRGSAKAKPLSGRYPFRLCSMYYISPQGQHCLNPILAFSSAYHHPKRHFSSPTQRTGDIHSHHTPFLAVEPRYLDNQRICKQQHLPFHKQSIKRHCRSFTNLVPSFFLFSPLFTPPRHVQKEQRPRGTVQPPYLDITTPSFKHTCRYYKEDKNKIRYTHHTQSS
ncbi:hypothetical protein M441DRAFT_223108 [Trichoderma asperellum CBS 433.97]|uniref:Secreted protein n=1 Tax=Trichoderma asperellum (strain ATCC 204424 / CBS 433.97 / NBRC 101777) TaxID=1042311 RepID=A0A2T3ZPM0_TRIA4|nr:hypothetical protein M441DRAFT_223108 [Trichoderma asperellum CBS 433.97]PTB46732.1 hypothetical protein M441DRAFT_223108 [Trichoderma asperellum CBS 433.97]